MSLLVLVHLYQCGLHYYLFELPSHIAVSFAAGMNCDSPKNVLIWVPNPGLLQLILTNGLSEPKSLTLHFPHKISFRDFRFITLAILINLNVESVINHIVPTHFMLLIYLIRIFKVFSRSLERTEACHLPRVAISRSSRAGWKSSYLYYHLTHIPLVYTQKNIMRSSFQHFLDLSKEIKQILNNP